MREQFKTWFATVAAEMARRVEELRGRQGNVSDMDWRCLEAQVRAEFPQPKSRQNPGNNHQQLVDSNLTLNDR